MTGVIHDLGYQRYQGRRLGRGYAVRSLYTHSLRAAYGLGRSAKAKVFPWLVVALVAMVAVVLTAVRALGGPVEAYPDFPDDVFLLVLLFAAVVAPELVSRDRRSGVLPLYFSRPIRPADYALAKLAALVSAVWLLLAGPLLVMFLGAAFTVDGWRAVLEELRDFGGGLAYAGLHALLFSALALLVASLVGRRAVAAGAIVGGFLVTMPVVGVLQAAGGAAVRELAGLFSPPTLVFGFREWVTGETATPGPGPWYGAVTVAVLVGCVGLLLLRYRRSGQ